MFNLVQLADATATTEVPELIPSRPAFRLADIFTEVAIPGTKAALDIGACSPDGTGAGQDCCESVWQKKTSRYAEYFQEVQENSVRDMPMVFFAAEDCTTRLWSTSSV